MSKTSTRYNASPSPLIAGMSPDELAAHMRQVGGAGNQNRITLNSAEVAALGRAFALLDRIYQRHATKLDRHLDGEADRG